MTDANFVGINDFDYFGIVSFSQWYISYIVQLKMWKMSSVNVFKGGIRNVTSLTNGIKWRVNSLNIYKVNKGNMYK